MKYFRLLFVLILFISLVHGALVLWHYQHDTWPSDLYNQPVLLRGEVQSLPHQKNNALQFWFKTPEGLIQLNWYYPFPKNLRPGQSWELHAKLKPDSFQGNVGEFDYGKYLKAQGILATGYVRADPAPHEFGNHPLNTPIESLRFYVYQRVIAATNHMSMQGILIALILGDKTLLNPHQWEVFSASGTSYFMVISGLHIALFATMGGLAARYLWCLIPRAPLLMPAQRVGLIVGLLFGILYSILAGFPVPTERALWMLWLMGIAKLFLERIHSMTLLFAAFLIVILWSPLSFNSVAFWLSFVAVFFLIYTMSARYRKLSKIEEWIYPQWVMYFCLMPILVYVFHEFSVISIVTNFLAMPFMMLAVIPLALLGGIFLFIIPALGHLLFLASNGIMTGLWYLLQWGVDSPKVLIHLQEPSLFAVIFSLTGCLILFAPKGFPLRLAGLWMMLPLIFPKPLVSEGAIKITTLQLEEGRVAIFETAHSVLIEEDLHHLREAKTAIHSVIEPYLQSRGIDEVQMWIVNGSKDYHALQSLENTWQSTKIDKIMLPHLPKTFDTSIITCEIPQRLVLDGVEFEITLRDNKCEVQVSS